VTCPDCGGEGQVYAPCDRHPFSTCECGPVEKPCGRCETLGAIDTEDRAAVVRAQIRQRSNEVRRNLALMKNAPSLHDAVRKSDQLLARIQSYMPPSHPDYTEVRTIADLCRAALAQVRTDSDEGVAA
jgi:hypothetical protein